MSDADTPSDSCFIDTNVWLYAFVEDNDPSKAARAKSLIRTQRTVYVSTQVINEVCVNLPSFAESHGCKPVDECEVGTLRSLGEGGYASEGSALRSAWRGATAVRPWGSTQTTAVSRAANPAADRVVLR